VHGSEERPQNPETIQSISSVNPDIVSNSRKRGKREIKEKEEATNHEKEIN
jgi:hypothetical protein